MVDAAATLTASLADRYRIERKLGAGGMATVYLAEDLRHHRLVALKVLRPELAVTLGTQRFEREIQIAARLQHPNILALLDSGEAGGFFYYVMPYVDGVSLGQRLEQEGALPIGDAVRILRDVVDALTEAHAHGVVHRDIKPENVMLHGRHAVVTDFGVAKALSEAAGRDGLTTAGLALGTPEYMAPEQASADPHVDHRVDIYAVGALAYELLTGRPVFIRATARAVLAAHMTEPPVPISKRRETVPPALEAVVMRCLEKKPGDRWQSAEDLLPQLEALVTPGGGTTPAQSPPWRRGRRWARAGAAGAALFLIAAAVALGLRGAGRPEDGTPRPVTDRSVAVLTFRPLSGDTADALLAAGLAEDIATTLGQVRLISVKSPAAVARAQAAASGDLAAVGRALGVRYVVDGSLRRMSDSVRLSARLVEPTTETQVWAATYDRASQELVRVPVDIARDLAVWLAGLLQPAEQAALERRPTQHPEAYEAYLRGNAKFFLRQRAANVSGITDYRRALALDPRFEAARARIAMMQAQQHDYGWYPAGADPSALLREALARADSSVEREPALAEGWTARCYVLYQLARLRDALDACDRALALDPRDL
jgi:serine/threonine-protein kinase